jgi:hypothetical protein
MLIYVIALLSCAICAIAGFWFYSAARERKHNLAPPQLTHQRVRNQAWDRAVRAARNRNW